MSCEHHVNTSLSRCSHAHAHVHVACGMWHVHVHVACGVWRVHVQVACACGMWHVHVACACGMCMRMWHVHGHGHARRPTSCFLLPAPYCLTAPRQDGRRRPARQLLLSTSYALRPTPYTS